MQIIKDGKIIQDDVRHLADDEAPIDGRFTVSLPRWLAEKSSLKACGVRLRGEDAVAVIAEDLPKLEMVVVEFPAMADGRGFSHARLLHDRYAYKGEVRARGDFIRDQVYFLHRVGINAFEPLAGTDLENMLAALEDFTVNYQAAVVERHPLYRRRS